MDSTAIQEFYRDVNVFVTGGTGFMGKVLIEKLLRSCPNVGRIFILIRTKKGQSPEDRKEELLKCVIFDVLRASSPEFHKKLVVVTGDCSLPKLGISNSDYEILIQKVNIIFHLAATVRFDEKFIIAIPINIGGTKEIIDLCRACVKLKSIVYTSTAYSNCHLKDIEECFYDPPFDIDEDINKFLCTTDEATIEILKPKILGKWPNTYTFTKSIAENILRTTAADLPLSIVRPSQVFSTVKEPICGWIDNLYGPTGAQIGYFSGFIKTGVRKTSIKINIVPVDLVINSIIAAAYIIGISSENFFGVHTTHLFLKSKLAICKKNL
uniref:Fatty acyl-CoA reductase n=1 Tax=Timema shepardi TaxID=629360 RepID=A0A7R9AZP1_TIMSH|nr:unnamed protein product [Timema shepardi]